MKKRLVIFVVLFIFAQSVSAESEKVWTREYLIEQGIGDDRISYERGTIFIDGIEFYVVEAVDGKSYALKNEFKKAVEGFLNGSLVVTIEKKDGTIMKKSGTSKL